MISPLPWLSSSGRYLTTRSLELDAPFLDEQHHGRRRRDRLGERSHVEDRVTSHRLGRRLDGPVPGRPCINNRPSPADDHHRARDLLLRDRPVDRRVDPLEAIGVETADEAGASGRVVGDSC